MFNSKKMLKNRFFFVISFLILLLLNPLTIPYVIAFSYNTITLPASINDNENPQTQSLHHSSGKFYYTYADDTNDKLVVYSYYPTGDEIGSTSITLSPIVTGSEVDDMRVKILELNSTHIIIICVYISSGTYMTCNFVVINIISSTVSQYYYTYTSSLYYGTSPVTQASPISYTIYNEFVYAIFTSSSDDSRIKTYLWLIEYDTSDNSVTKQLQEQLEDYQSQTLGSYVLVYQDENITNNLYLCTSLQSDITLPKYYRVDLDTFDFELLATHPTSTRYTENRKFFPLSSYIKYDGDDIYLVFNWIFPHNPSDVKTLKLVQHRLLFNLTISTSNLLDQNERVISIIPNLNTGSSKIWSIGFLNDYDNITVYFPTTESGTYYCLKRYFIVDDWFNFVDNSIEVTKTEYDNLLPFVNEYDDIGRDLTGTFQSNEYNPTSTRIYYDLEPFYKIYDIDLENIPSGTTLNQYSQYLFTIYTIMNDEPISTQILIYIDDVLYGTKSTDAYGEYDFTYTFSISGYHSIMIMMYDDGILVKVEEFDYIITQSTVEYPTIDTTIPLYINLLNNFIPIMFVLGIPSLTMYTMTHSILGFTFGMVIGVYIGVQSGFIPVYLVFMTMLIVAIGFILIIKMGGSEG